MKKFLYLFVFIGFTSTVQAGSYDDFFRAVVRNDPAEVRAWVAKGFDPNARDPSGQPAIMRALMAESYDVALELAQTPGLDPNTRNRTGETPLMTAALKGRIGVCAALVEHGAEVSPASGWTPLHYAAAGNSIEATRLLLRQGARIDARAPNRRTPLMLAALYAGEEVIGTLLASGADASLRDQNDATPADLARSQGRDKLADALDQRAAAPPQSR